jgi:hypothetical protein
MNTQWERIREHSLTGRDPAVTYLPPQENLISNGEYNTIKNMITGLGNVLVGLNLDAFIQSLERSIYFAEISIVENKALPRIQKLRALAVAAKAYRQALEEYKK